VDYPTIRVPNQFQLAMLPGRGQRAAEKAITHVILIPRSGRRIFFISFEGNAGMLRFAQHDIPYIPGSLLTFKS
jgi:hypothetical protein